MIIVRSLFAIVVLPGTAAVFLPSLLLRDAQFAGGPAWLGLLPLASGLALFAWCVTVFALRGRGTLAPWDPPRRVVSAGPYGLVRNPMYLGVGLVVLGESILSASWSLLAYVVVLALVWHGFVTVYEEPTLERAFGDEYRAYKSRVPRWIPRA